MNLLLFVVHVVLCAYAATIPDLSPKEVLDDALLLWGPYRPNLYLGLRPRVPKSLLMGLMWYRAEDSSHITKSLRHTCEQNEGMAGYGWTNYDIRKGGTQIINDTGNGVDLVAGFAKISASADDQTWGLNVQGLVRDGANADQQITVVFYVGSEDSQSSLECSNKLAMGSDTETLPYAACDGNVHSKFDFNIEVASDQQAIIAGSRSPEVSVNSMNVDSDTIWKAKDMFLDQVKEEAGYGHMLRNTAGSGNLQFVQITFSGDFNFDILFSSSTRSKPDTSTKPLYPSIENTRIAFDEQFTHVYRPRQPFLEEEYHAFSKSLLSNLMGGIGFFQGTSKVNSDANAEKTSLSSADGSVVEQGPYQLFSAVPSRPFFPRGFLWDEGFHLQVVIDWDMDLALEILSSWLNLMDENGWIAREQILGPEARSKVPPEFQTQYQHYANPPTMFRVVEMFVERLTGEIPYSGAPSQYLKRRNEYPRSGLPKEGRGFLESVYSKLQKHYEWFIKTQAGTLNKYGPSPDGSSFKQGFRWRGRTPQHILTSGLDDYPRAPSPSNYELHLDALCWVGFMTKILHKISDILAPDDPITSQYSNNLTSILTTLDNIHWSEPDQAYCDTTIETSSTREITHICHKGYISLFPFLTGLLPPTHPHLPSILSLIASPNHLWSSHGLRSLSLSSSLYGTGEDYWRGPIWININYMALEQLLALAQRPGPHSSQAARLYTRLRRNIITTVFESWKNTGFAWEQYNPETGKGQRTQHFTGWTALVVRIMAMPEIDGGAGDVLSGEDPVVVIPVEEGSGMRTNLLFLVMVIFTACVVFRRKLSRIWRVWLEDR